MDKGRAVLFKTFAIRNGCDYTEPTPEEFVIAVAQGYMFEETHPLSHQDTLEALQQVILQIDPADVANAFLYSLSTRELAYRSALGSYWYAKAVPFHEPRVSHWCTYCGWIEGYGDNRIQKTKYYERKWMPKHTLENCCNYDRQKFGGCHHTETPYALFDLQQFMKMPKVTHTNEDRAMLREILYVIAELEPSKKAGAYRDLLHKKKIIPTNRDEISVLIDILGICGILSTVEHPCPDVEFRGRCGIDPPEIRNCFAYPVNWWRAKDGVNEERFLKVFGFPYKEL